MIHTNIDSYNFLEIFLAVHPQLQRIEDLPIEPHKKKQKAKKHVMNQNSNSTMKVQAKKPRQVNWEYAKILTFMQAKKAEHEEIMAEVDSWDKFQTSVTRCKKISAVIMNVGCSKHVKNGPTCKDKWSTISSNFKKLFNFMVSTGQNQDYWAMSAQKKNNVQLPCNFERGIFVTIGVLLIL